MPETKINPNTISTFADDIKKSLSEEPKKIPSKYLYDAAGSRLFQAIMSLKEYYLTDCEFEILSLQKEKILTLFSEDQQEFNLIEFGAGDGLKTKLLLKHFSEKNINFKYFPIDISGEAISGLTASLKKEIPSLKVHGIRDDYFNALSVLKENKEGKHVVLFLGSNIGNFDVTGTSVFLTQLRANLQPGDLAMIGFDLKKDPEIILNAYNDASGVTREFTFNGLKRMNVELGANFDLTAFKHYPTYDPTSGEVRSYLMSLKEQTVTFSQIDFTLKLQRWEPIRTEISRKHDIPEINKLADNHGFKVKEHLFDCKHFFVDSVWEAK